VKHRRGKWFERLDERRLRVLFAAFFIALAVPAAVLVAQAYSQLKWQAFRGTQLAAEELAARIDAELLSITATEEARSFGDYSFLIVEGDTAANFVQRSPLTAFPVQSELPGVLGYFQVDSEGQLTTPLLPEAGVAAANYGIPAAEEAARAARVAELREILAQNQLVQPQPPAEEVIVTGTRIRREAPYIETVPQAVTETETDAAGAAASQAAFDRLAVRGVSDDRALLDSARSGLANFGMTSVAESVSGSEEQLRRQADPGDREKRIEQSLAFEAAVPTAPRLDDSAAPQPESRVVMFESEVDPFDFGMLDTGHFVLFRNVWREGQRYIQGAVVERAGFLAAVIETPYRASALAGVSDLDVRLQSESLASLSATPARRQASALPDLAGTLLHRARLSPPFGDMELLFGVISLPRAAGTGLLAWVTVALAAVLCGGFFFMYRMAAQQMRLARQQQDFVSAVSHELKTPLTSIRMYGELLKSGWADEAKKQSYYDYIHSESERLSRLIDNVLQLARLTRNTQKLDMRLIAVSELADMVRSKVGTQVDRAGFELRLRDETPPHTSIEVDSDCFAQIFINLVDNALKFSAAAETKVVEIACRLESDGARLFTVRDYGPGVPKALMKKIFELFYRPSDELTRDTVGTGIGLALVRQLADAMHGAVDVRNREPGAEFRLRFPPPGT
jgi:signal transduction histidine kinase